MKTLWHSQIQQPLRVKVTSDALESRYKKSGEAGHFYVKLEVNGEERSYAAENIECARILGEMKNEGEITIKGEGRGADDARIIVMGATEQERRPPPLARTNEIRDKSTWGTERLPEDRPNIRPDQDPIQSCNDAAARCCNAFYLIQSHVNDECDQSAVNGFVTTAEHRQAKVSSIFIHLDRAGLLAGLPTDPLWSVANKSMRAEAGRLADRLRDEGALGHS